MEVHSVSLGKNFRLPLDCKPVRYSAHLAPDLARGTFEGRMEVEVRLEAPRREIHLHAVGLEISRARARIQDRAWKATPAADAESETITLRFGELASTPEEKARAYPVGTWAVPQKQALTAFGQQVALAVLPLLEDYFGQPYAYGKVDQVGVPDFEAGAMENAACITYREVALLLDPKSAPLNVQKRVAEVITHELSHQWFGNLVTMVWWDDLW